MLKVGKLNNELLEKIVFGKIRHKRPEVMMHPGVGEDCAVIDFGEYECVISTDPITATVEKIGSLAVHVACNDIASNGVEPLGVMMTILLPHGVTEKDVEEIMEEAGETAAELGVEIMGGHTEITKAVHKPVIVSTAVGRGKAGSSQCANDMQPGDYILITKKAALEGTGIIASDHARELYSFLSQEEIDAAAHMLKEVSVVKEGVIAGGIGTAGMHDITEGGVLGAVYEMCQIAGVGAIVHADDVPISRVTHKICEHFELDPLKLISSGSMMIIAHEDRKAQIEDALGKEDIDVTCIGRIVDKDKGLKLIRFDKEFDIEAPTSDEIYSMGEHV